MSTRKIIEQEVDKQEWGIELPKYVMLGGRTALRLTDKGTYHRDAGKWDVEYRVVDDKVYSVSPVSSVDGKELTPTTKDEWHKQNKDYYFDEKSLGSFDWTSNTYDQNNLGESDEFDWAEKTPVAEKIPRWSGKHDGTEPGNGGKTFMYADENGKEHSIKVGGTTYKYRTRSHSGGFFGSDGEVSFYDSSITGEEITNLNNDPDYPDPFDGKFEIEITRSEYNEYVGNGRLKYQIYDNFYPMNESEFGWVDKISGEDFHVGTKFRYFHREYDENSDNTYEILNVDPNGDVGISVRNIDNDNIKPLTLRYDSVKEGFDSGTYENISVRDTIDTFIHPGSKFVIENAWWEGERDGIRHPREEGRLIIQLTSVDEFGDSNYVIIESELPIGEPVGTKDVVDINKLRTYIRTDWWEPYNG